MIIQADQIEEAGFPESRTTHSPPVSYTNLNYSQNRRRKAQSCHFYCYVTIKSRVIDGVIDGILSGLFEWRAGMRGGGSSGAKSLGKRTVRE
jgi:hypothetical protein